MIYVYIVVAILTGITTLLITRKIKDRKKILGLLVTIFMLYILVFSIISFQR